tara:strand:- start:573 stop:827 length:255 start_codon:yes stop_codon:yes gene_type:complete
MSDETTKAKHITEYIKSLSAIEDCIRPYQDQRRDLARNYVSNKWLSKEEIRLAKKAYRLMSDDVDFEQLGAFYDRVVEASKEAN